MFDLFRQPNNYSEMLSRIAFFTIVAGVISMLLIAWLSPDLRALLSKSGATVDIGFGDIPLLLIVVPFFVALFARAFRLHDRISNFFGIRRYFDEHHILEPLARGAGVVVDARRESAIREHRHRLMKNTFYKYAPNATDAVINKQYVANALDQWGWFWCCVEPAAIYVLAAIIGGFLVSSVLSAVFAILVALLLVVAYLVWPSCVRNAQLQVEDILEDASRKQSVGEQFNAV
jgi:hypothetical protein